MLISDWSSDVCSSDLIAASEFIAALQRVDDADLAKRATALAIAANDENLALQAAQRWLQVEPTSMDAREVIARVALSHRDLATTRSEEHTSELQSLMRISYAVFCLKKKKKAYITNNQ